MRSDDKLFSMNGVVYYSNTGQSRMAARYLAGEIGWPVFDLEQAPREYEVLALVFPVHCQNIPTEVVAFLNRVNARYLVAVATYGRMWHGNVLQELQRRCPIPMAAAAYLPAKHAYLPEDDDVDCSGLDPLLQKLRHPAPVTIPRSFKNPLSGLLPGLRSRMGVRLERSDRCNNCGICDRICPNGAMVHGVPNGNCGRCLRCVSLCPQRALHTHPVGPMKWYLRKPKTNQVKIYL